MQVSTFDKNRKGDLGTKTAHAKFSEALNRKTVEGSDCVMFVYNPTSSDVAAIQKRLLKTGLECRATKNPEVWVVGTPVIDCVID